MRRLFQVPFVFVQARMNILLSIFFSPRPRGVIDMPATVSKWLCRKGYTAITLFGRIYTREQVEADKLNSTLGALKNHEMIHLRQAQNTCNSWLVFYFLIVFLCFAAMDDEGAKGALQKAFGFSNGKALLVIAAMMVYQPLPTCSFTSISLLLRKLFYS